MTLQPADVISLDHPRAVDTVKVGAKAATLARLRRAGLPVPPGVVIPVARLDGAHVSDLEPLVEGVRELLGDGPWAVRSSGVSEDQTDRSFAGQFLTTLNVTAEGLMEAVLATHRSSMTDHAKVYAGEKAEAGIPVLIQPMVDARAAGVAFTIDPVTGVEETTVEAVAGLAEDLVSGAAEPERWRVKVGQVTASVSPAILSENEARAVAELAAQVESLSEGPQDIEWAIDAGGVVLLQARPITTATPPFIPIPIEVPPGTWTSDRSHMPWPPKPFGSRIFEKPTLPVALAEFGVMIDDIRFVTIGGWGYMQVQPTGAPPPREGGSDRTPPRWLLTLAMKLHPAIRRRAKVARAAVESDLAGTYLTRWEEEWRPELVDDIERAFQLDLGSLSDVELVAELDHRTDVIYRSALTHTRLGAAITLPLYRLTEVCRRLLGWDDRQTLDLLEGLSEASTMPGRLMAALVAEAKRDTDLTDLLTSGSPDINLISTKYPKFARSFDDYIRAVGHRGLEYDVSSPTLAESPETILGLVAHHLETGYDPEGGQQTVAERRAAAEQRAREQLAGKSEDERAEFEQALTAARRAYPVREDNEWYTNSVQIALLRYLALEFGNRLTDLGLLSTPDDVFFADIPDLKAALLEGNDLRPLVSENKGRWAWALANPGPEIYGAETADIDIPLGALPRAARFVNEAALWTVAKIMGDASAHEGDDVSGLAASAGHYAGPARIVHGEQDFAKIRPGDVVVCPATSPVWSIVFPSMGALVTDSGGILSHPAIIAREHGIPAVVGTRTATLTFHDGELVAVDGDAGTVRHVHLA
jgi:rifampicin phosphotransferase